MLLFFSITLVNDLVNVLLISMFLRINDHRNGTENRTQVKVSGSFVIPFQLWKTVIISKIISKMMIYH